MTHGLALANLIVIVLILVVATGATLAKTRRFRRHCLVMRAAIGIQVLTIAIVMAPSLAGYLRSWHGWSWLTSLVVVHHTLGVVVILLFIYINLAFTGVVKAPRRYRPFMLTALTLWVISLAMGVYLYWYIWR
jgi:hypothetical protein